MMSTTEGAGFMMVRPNQTPTIPLSKLLDFTVQRIYHELQVLSELLPRKSDMEKKIEIVQYANRTRTLLIRLFALVKWASSATKVEKCSVIMNFLENQSMLFVSTADRLMEMSRNTLSNARLPMFQIPGAIDVLTKGTYSKLPTCIKEKILPPEPITLNERREVLLRLNQIIMQRLSSNRDLPFPMRNLDASDGRVTFTVPYEFKVVLTLRSDKPTEDWTVLEVDILVKDKETGDGVPYVNTFQKEVLKRKVQAHMLDNPSALKEAYNILHGFCLSLQVMVLHNQLNALRDRLQEFVRIDRYDHGRLLQVSCWIKKGSTPPFTITLQVDHTDDSKPLQVIHTPELKYKEDQTIFDGTLGAGHLSFEKIFIHTVQVRSRTILEEVKQVLMGSRLGSPTIGGCPPVLEVPYLQDCLSPEKLRISVDTLTGRLMAYIPQFDEIPKLDRFESVYKNKRKLDEWVNQLIVWIVKERCKKTVELLPVKVRDHLPLLPEDEGVTSKMVNPLFLHLIHHPNMYLAVNIEVVENPLTLATMAAIRSRNGDYREVNFTYKILMVEHVAIDGSTRDMTPGMTRPRPFVQIVKQNTVNKDRFDGSFCSRKRLCTVSSRKESYESSNLYPLYRYPELARIITSLDERTWFGNLGAALDAVNISYVPTFEDIMPGLELINFPPSSRSLLKDELISINIRFGGSERRCWQVSAFVSNCPVVTKVHPASSSGEPQAITEFVFKYQCIDSTSDSNDRMVRELMEDWKSVDRLFNIMKSYQEYQPLMQSVSTLKSYDYRRAIFTYGPDNLYNMEVIYKAADERYNLVFGLDRTGGHTTNPHTIVVDYLRGEFNRHYDLPQLLCTLDVTWPALRSLTQLNQVIIPNVFSGKQIPVLGWALIPSAMNAVTLVYRGQFYIDVKILEDGRVEMRDRVVSVFERLKSQEEHPILGLHQFLSKYAIKGTSRPRADGDDLLPPPSPQVTGMDVDNKGNLESLLTRNSQHMHSNPNTPASPHPSVMSSQGGYAASPASFPMAASPAVAGHMDSHHSPAMFNVNSPANPMHAPSPGGFMPTPSPGMNNPMASPAPSFMAGHDHSINSPFHSNMNMHSPAPVGWPGSPISRPSPRPMGSAQSPGSSGVIAPPPPGIMASFNPRKPGIQFECTPSILTASSLELLLKPVPEVTMGRNPMHPQPTKVMVNPLCPLEKFLGCVAMRTWFAGIVKDPKSPWIILLEPPTSNMIHFRTDTMSFRVTMNQVTMQSLVVRVEGDTKIWTPEECETLQRFIESRVLCPPFSQKAIHSLIQLLGMDHKVLKDVLNVLRLDLQPDPSMRWLMQFNMCIHPGLPTNFKPGMESIVCLPGHVIFSLTFTRNGPPVDTYSIMVSFEFGSRILKMLSNKNAPEQVAFHKSVVKILERFNEYNGHHSNDPFPIFNTIKAIVTEAH